MDDDGNRPQHRSHEKSVSPMLALLITTTLLRHRFLRDSVWWVLRRSFDGDCCGMCCLVSHGFFGRRIFAFWWATHDEGQGNENACHHGEHQEGVLVTQHRGLPQ